MHPVHNDWDERARQLLRSAEEGHSMALGQLLELFRSYLLSIAQEEIPGDLSAKVNPSDVVQETYFEACRLFGQFRGSEAHEFRAWLRGILLNKLRDLCKRYFHVQSRQVGREESLDGYGQEIGHPGSHSTPSGHVVRNEQTQHLQEAMARLPEQYQQVLAWRTWEALSFAEIGRRLSRTEDAARMLFTRALKHLQQEMRHEDAPP